MAQLVTFEDPCRALTSALTPDDNASRYLVGTQTSNRKCNEIHLFEYRDDSSLARITFKFPHGDVWHLCASSKYPNLVTGVTSRKRKFNVSLYSLPQEVEAAIEDDFGLSQSQIEKKFDLISDASNPTRQCHWHPDDSDQLLTCNNGDIEFWDLDTQSKALTYSIQGVLSSSGRLETPGAVCVVNDLRWSSLFNCSVVGAAIGKRIYGVDTRIPDSSPASICWLIEDARCNRVRTIDFNPNSQYYVASGGDDGRASFWDLRKTSQPVLSFQAHTHWIWSIRYNPFHDELVLSSGSDARVALMRIPSIASEPYGQIEDLDDDDMDEDNEHQSGDGEESKVQSSDVSINNGDTTGKGSGNDNAGSNDVSERPDSEARPATRSKDEIAKTYDDHDDSVYAAEWASDPWVFATLGFESRLVITKVPKTEKLNILF